MRRPLAILLVAVSALVVLIVLIVLRPGRSASTTGFTTPSVAGVNQAGRLQTSASCAGCHADIHAAWSGTDHALANRPPDPGHGAALATFPRPEELGADTPGQPLLILGHQPLWQPLVPSPGGRWQAHELAYDPERKEWFNVFGDAARKPGEWGHWTGRGMNWNTMCAPCHMTGYDPGYDAASDTFRSTWVEQGVGCIRCHGEPPVGHGLPGADVSKTHYGPFSGDRARHADLRALSRPQRGAHRRHASRRRLPRPLPGDPARRGAHLLSGRAAA